MNSFAYKILHPILYGIKIYSVFKYSKHLSIIFLNNVANGSTFQFSNVSVNDDDVFKEIKTSACAMLFRVMEIKNQCLCKCRQIFKYSEAS